MSLKKYKSNINSDKNNNYLKFNILFYWILKQLNKIIYNSFNE